jgi:hypothetical protein
VNRLILWSIFDYQINGAEYIIPAMVEGELISKILEHLRKGNGLYIPKPDKRIDETFEYSQELEKRFNEIIKNIRMGP